jgi:NAD(P)-dependent dehydrogenase (short-subunit alcohol dehydrogenase family)
MPAAIPADVGEPLAEIRIPEAIKAQVLTTEPTGAFVPPEDVGTSAVFGCSDTAARVTDANFPIHGEWSAE